MRNIRSSRRRDCRVNAEISFTNLIDVAFVLLIIFMITAPIMQGGIELELPRADAAPLTQSEAVVVSVTATAACSWMTRRSAWRSSRPSSPCT
jgi:biopolymer transport protein ExbD